MMKEVCIPSHLLMDIRIIHRILKPLVEKQVPHNIHRMEVVWELHHPRNTAICIHMPLRVLRLLTISTMDLLHQDLIRPLWKEQDTLLTRIIPHHVMTWEVTMVVIMVTTPINILLTLLRIMVIHLITDTVTCGIPSCIHPMKDNTAMVLLLNIPMDKIIETIVLLLHLPILPRMPRLKPR